MSHAFASPDADLRRAVEPFVGPDSRRASLQLITTFGALALNMTAIHFALSWSVPLALLLAVPAAGLLVRVFIFMHDCTHGSFLANRTASDAVGFITGVLTLTPFAQWRRDHALHHASSGDLDRRGHGDIPTLTVREYQARSPRGKLMYRIVRHPAALLFGGPIHLAIGQRFRGKSKATGSLQIASVWTTNAAIALLITIAVLTVGWQTFFFAYVVPYYIAAMVGVWLFYVQHQFEDAYWLPKSDWRYADAALRGSSHLKLPAPLQWITGSIGLHHVHHVAPRIPNYRLQDCHDSSEIFHHSPTIDVRSGMAAMRLALWDEDAGRLVRFRDVAPLS